MKVYVFGPIHINGESYVPLYKHVGEFCKKYFNQVIGTYPDFWDSKETPREFYDRTYNTITTADYFIAEVTNASMGVGMELQMGREHNIPCIAVCKQGHEPSPMVKGLPNLKEIVFYTNLNNLTVQLDKIFNTILNK